MDLIQEIYDRAARYSAIRARELGDDKWAFKSDDKDTMKQWIMKGTLKVAVACSIIKFDSGESPEPDVLPDELLDSVVYYLIAEYYDTIGEIRGSGRGGVVNPEGQYWRAKHEDELNRYRFDPHTKTTARRPYRMAY
jgi:hypothetical protein